MKNSEWDIFVEMVATLADVYGKKINANLIGVYFNSLKEYDLEYVKRAFNMHVRNPDSGQYFPKPADVVRLIEGDTNTQSMRAWTKVIDAIKSVGSWRSVVFDDPIIHRVITDMGGWPKVAGTTVAETPFVAKEFEKRYQGYGAIKMTLNADHPKVLLGISDENNLSKGYASQPPALIGNSQAALDTMKSGQFIGSRGTQVTFAGLLNGFDKVQRRGIREDSEADGDDDASSSASYRDGCIRYEEGAEAW